MPSIETPYRRDVWMAEVKRRQRRLDSFNADFVISWRCPLDNLTFDGGRREPDLLFPEERGHLIRWAARSFAGDAHPRRPR